MSGVRLDVAATTRAEVPFTANNAGERLPPPLPQKKAALGAEMAAEMHSTLHTRASYKLFLYMRFHVLWWLPLGLEAALHLAKYLQFKEVTVPGTGEGIGQKSLLDSCAAL